MKIVALIVVLLLSSFSNAYGETIMEQVIPSGKIKVQLAWPEVLPDKLYNAHVRFLEPDTDELLDKVTITYDAIILQHDGIIEEYIGESTDKDAQNG